MKLRFSVLFPVLLLCAALLAPHRSAAQTVAYRQTNLVSDLPNVAGMVNMNLKNPWGMAFLPGQPFFVAQNKAARVNSFDAGGNPGAGFGIPGLAATSSSTPTGIAGDPNSFFGTPAVVTPFVVVTQEGGIFIWGPDARGDLLQQAILVVDASASGAVFKGVTLMQPPLSSATVAVTDFAGGFIRTFLPGFAPVALSGPFEDPNLPAGYAPFGIQTVGDQVFVTYAVQDASKKDAVSGNGNGIVSIFDMDGNFLRRFATGGSLNAPWGVAQAGANFGPFSNDILIGNVGDGTISAFDPTTGNFLGQLKDGDDNVLGNSNLHGLAFRTDGFADANKLYFTAGISNGQDGLFATLVPGLVSITNISVAPTVANTAANFTATVAAAPGNPGTPTGSVAFTDSGVALGSATLVNGVANFSNVLTGVGSHTIEVRYSGDPKFLPSTVQTQLPVTGPPTDLSLTAPANAAPGSPVNLVATIRSPGGTPTGTILFQDGSTGLGSATLNAAGVATLTVTSLAAGTHSITAVYGGDGSFAGSTSAAVSVTIAARDFSFAATPPSATVMVGQSAQFMLTINPSGGFADNVSFSCPAVAGITCAFSPATVTPNGAAASTTLTVGTSLSAAHFGVGGSNLARPAYILATLLAFLLLLRKSRQAQTVRGFKWALPAVALLVLPFMGGCGGGSSAMQTNRGTASLAITAQSGAITHTTTVSVTVQ